jgi:hypothetical protein
MLQDVSGFQRSVMLQDISGLTKSVVLLEVSGFQRSVVLLGVSIRAQKILKLYVNSMLRIRCLFDPGSGMKKSGSGIKIPDPKH